MIIDLDENDKQLRGVVRNAITDEEKNDLKIFRKLLTKYSKLRVGAIIENPENEAITFGFFKDK